jgi:hypothetical protein
MVPCGRDDEGTAGDVDEAASEEPALVKQSSAREVRCTLHPTPTIIARN